MSTDAQLFRHIQRVMRQCITTYNGKHRYVDDSKLIWSGKHYLLVRTGPYQGCREAELWSREALLLDIGNQHKIAMLEIALATIPPFIKEWSANRRQILWRTGISHGEFAFLRWSNTLKNEIISHCEVLDASFEERASKEEERWKCRHNNAREMCDLFIEAGIAVNGTIRKNGVDYPSGSLYTINLTKDGSGESAQVKFVPQKDRVVTFASESNLSTEEFRILARAFIEINNIRLKKRDAAISRVVASATQVKGN